MRYTYQGGCDEAPAVLQRRATGTNDGANCGQVQWKSSVVGESVGDALGRWYARETPVSLEQRLSVYQYACPTTGPMSIDDSIKTTDLLRIVSQFEVAISCVLLIASCKHVVLHA